MTSSIPISFVQPLFGDSVMTVRRFILQLLVGSAAALAFISPAVAIPTAKVFYAHANTNPGLGHGCPCTIGVVNDDGTGNQTIHTNLTGPSVFAIDIDPANEHIYWTEHDRVRRSKFDGTGIIDVVTNLSDLTGLSLDLVNERVYWVERFDAAQNPNSGTAGSADLNGINLDVQTHLTGLNRPFGIEVDPINSMKFYFGGETQGSPTLQRADLNGANLQTIVTIANASSFGVTVDPDLPSLASPQLYFTTTGSGIDKVRSSDLDGSNLQTLSVPTQSGGLFGIDVLPSENRIFWVSKNSYYIATSKTSGTQYQLVLSSMPGSPTDVAVMPFVIPEPSAITLAALALLGMSYCRRKRA